jgi:hypothetical protein
MQITISNIFEFGPDQEGNGYYGFTVLTSLYGFKNHIFTYKAATRSKTNNKTKLAYQNIQNQLLNGTALPKEEIQ